MSLCSLPSTYSLVLKHHYALKILLLLKLFSRGNFLASNNSLNFYLHYYLSYKPNIYLSRGYLLWCIHVVSHFHQSKWKINSRWQPSLDGRYLQGSMTVILFRQYLLWITLSPGTSWCILENSLYCASIINYDKINWLKNSVGMHLIPSQELNKPPYIYIHPQSSLGNYFILTVPPSYPWHNTFVIPLNRQP